jgi:hypothetical protein
MAELDLGTIRTPDFEKPIPGQGLMSDPENPMAFEKPVAISTLSDGINKVFLTVTEEGSFESILNSMKAGIAITELTHFILFEGFRKGMWNPDLMLMLAEPVMFMLIAFAEKASIDYVLYEGEEEEEEGELSDEEKIELNQRFTQLIEQQLRNGSKVSTLPSEMQERLEELEIPEQFKEKSLMEKTETTEQTEEII